MEEKYGVNESPGAIISHDDLKSEWLDLRIYLLSNCGKMSVRGVLTSLALKITLLLLLLLLLNNTTSSTYLC